MGAEIAGRGWVDLTLVCAACKRYLGAMEDVKQAIPSETSEAGPKASDGMLRRRRKTASSVAWQRSDVEDVVSLALWLLPSWILPERFWAPIWRAKMRLSALTGARGSKRTAKDVRKALGDRDGRECQSIMLNLRAAIHELQLQDLRGWRPGGWHPRMALEGEEHLRDALGAGKGAILWVAPFVFNSGPTKIVLHEKGYRVSHLSSPRHGYSETMFGVRYLNRVRCIPEDRYLVQRIVFDRNAPSTAMRRMMRALKAKEVVSIVAASTEGSDMIKGPIFDGWLPVAVGAPRLAGLTGAPLLPVFTVRGPDNRFRIAIEAPIPIAAGGSADEQCMAAAAEFLRRSEPWIRAFPEQWRAWSKWRAK